MTERPIDPAWAKWGTQLLRELYGLTGVLTRLPGEHDLNFVVHQDGCATFVLKVTHPDVPGGRLEMQAQALAHIHRIAPDVPVPDVVPTVDDTPSATRRDPEGSERIVWLLHHLPGEIYARVRPKPPALLGDLGRTLARMALALDGFDHPHLADPLKWDLRRSRWIRPHLPCIAGPSKRALVREILDAFEERTLRSLEGLPVTALHNDVNDHNILVDVRQPTDLRISGIVDFGDMVEAPFVCDLAVAAAYCVFDQPRPFDALRALVSGYNSVRALSDLELSLIFPLMLVRLAVSVTNAAVTKRERPDDPYVTISEKPAWDFLMRHGRTHPAWVLGLLRTALDKPVLAGANHTVEEIRAARGTYAPVIRADLEKATVLDFSPDGDHSPQDPLQPHRDELRGSGLALGRYREPRLFYVAPQFALGPHPISDRRTVHLGVDVFAEAGTPVHAPADGIVRSAAYRDSPGDYGGVVILEHRTPSGRPFFSLYGHLARKVLDRLEPGQAVARGTAFAMLGNTSENGGWPPHLHLQLGLTALGPDHDWPGVANPEDLETAVALFPNPAVLLNLADELTEAPLPSTDTLIERRRRRFSRNLETSYDTPVIATRGWRHYIFDPMGRAYLDAYNNVPHVGHAHPRLTEVLARQSAMINTNTRYLHPARPAYAEALAALLPDPLDTCFFVNSASEANELALRLARAHTGSKHVITLDTGYHGHTISAIDISPYKFNGPGGEGPPDWVHVVPVADPYRGPHRGPSRETGRAYAEDAARAARAIAASNGRLGAFIGETFPSVGGQIVPPDGYLAAVYAVVRAAGGVCIADEVQTGLGRLGRFFWGFAQQEAVPDIVVLGKPLGNGYPLAAVVTTQAIAASFANGMEFFSTFGGSTLACVVGREVLRILEDERLPENAEETGAYLLQGLRELAGHHPVIGDVRGLGFFIGVDLVLDPETRVPAPVHARYVVNRMRAHRILIGRDGPHENVLKIRPPMTFGRADADVLLSTLATILEETPVQPKTRER